MPRDRQSQFLIRAGIRAFPDRLQCRPFDPLLVLILTVDGRSLFLVTPASLSSLSRCRWAVSHVWLVFLRGVGIFLVSFDTEREVAVVHPVDSWVVQGQMWNFACHSRPLRLSRTSVAAGDTPSGTLATEMAPSRVARPPYTRCACKPLLSSVFHRRVLDQIWGFLPSSTASSLGLRRAWQRPDLRLHPRPFTLGAAAARDLKPPSPVGVCSRREWPI